MTHAVLTLLRWRQIQEDARQAEAAALRAEHQHARDALDHVTAHAATAAAQYREATASPLDGWAVQTLYPTEVPPLLAQARENLTKATRQLEAKLEEVREATQAKKLVNTIAHRLRQQAQHRQARREQSVLDDLIANRHLRKDPKSSMTSP